MTTRLRSAVSATALSLALLAGAASAQDLGLQQLQDAATGTLSSLNMDTSVVDRLTLDELTQIEAANSTGETDQSKMARIETILRDAEERIAAGGSVIPEGAAGDVSADQLDGIMVVKETVRTDLAQLGLGSEIDVDTLTDEQLMRIQLIASGSDADDAQRQQIQQVIAE